MSSGPEWAILSFRPATSGVSAAERIMCISFSWWVSSRALQPISQCIITTSIPIIPSEAKWGLFLAKAWSGSAAHGKSEIQATYIQINNYLPTRGRSLATLVMMI